MIVSFHFLFLQGFISKEEFEEACSVLNKFNEEVIPGSNISDLAKALDINKDGKIDFNEFLEAFRLVNNSIEEKSITLDTETTQDEAEIIDISNN